MPPAYYRRPTPSAPPHFSWTPYIVMGVVLFIVLALAPRIGFRPMMLLLIIGIPIGKRMLAMISEYFATHNTESGQPDDVADGYGGKRKNRPYRASSANAYDFEDEKPKNRPEYMVGDDGELVELESSQETDKVKRSSDNRDYYV